MPIQFPASVPNDFPSQRQLMWSKSERTIARSAFDHALNQELQEVIQQAKRMASEIKQASQLWDLEEYLKQRRKEINRKYEYRASRLITVFGTLLHEGLITAHDLRGLQDDKLGAIRRDADFLSSRDEAS